MSKGVCMPLIIAPRGEEMRIVKIAADGKTCRHLESLGIVPGAGISLLSATESGMIVRVLGSRLALDSATARAIVVAPAA